MPCMPICPIWPGSVPIAPGGGYWLKLGCDCCDGYCGYGMPAGGEPCAAPYGCCATCWPELAAIGTSCGRCVDGRPAGGGFGGFDPGPIVGGRPAAGMFALGGLLESRSPK